MVSLLIRSSTVIVFKVRFVGMLVTLNLSIVSVVQFSSDVWVHHPANWKSPLQV